MNSSLLLRWVVIAALGYPLTQCVSPPEEPVPTLLSEAIEFTEKGRIAFEEGRFQDASLSYAEALNVHRSIDNHLGIIRNLYNLAVVQKADRKASAALESLDALDRWVNLREQSVRAGIQDKQTLDIMGEAAWLRARILLERGNDEQAQRVLDEVARTPGQSRNPRIKNFQARLFLAQGDAAQARSAAAIAWSGSRGNKANAEKADAARYQGKAAEMLGQSEVARSWYERALALDQKLARSGLVAEDLLGLARSSLLMQNPEQASAYATRALNSARAAKDGVREKQAQSWMASALKVPPPGL